MSPGTYPPPSTCQPNLFDQATTGSFPICYGEIAETMQDQRSAFQNSYVAAQSVSQSLGDDLDELLPVSSYLSYPPPLPSLQPSVSNDLNPSDLQGWFAPIYGGSDDTSFGSILFGDLYDSIGAENPYAPGNYLMETTNCAQNDFPPLFDFPTLAPGTNNVLDVENPKAFHAAPRSALQPEYTDVVASGIQTPQYELSLRPTYVSASYLSPSSSHPSVRWALTLGFIIRGTYTPLATTDTRPTFKKVLLPMMVGGMIHRLVPLSPAILTIQRALRTRR
ncbi:hypothetical protein ARMSODRAFT_966531 [Armillaria solidipes]|uniref:Uncharacterized protein n=1 Tax=Armillaria solidipes TaxID=1076256 RepID=A0A2H3B7Q8_9AGAR|nr:hypothetical protein ARMSODRAFT_966531 [Armillaria solidipes]